MKKMYCVLMCALVLPWCFSGLAVTGEKDISVPDAIASSTDASLKAAEAAQKAADASVAVAESAQIAIDAVTKAVTELSRQNYDRANGELKTASSALTEVQANAKKAGNAASDAQAAAEVGASARDDAMRVAKEIARAAAQNDLYAKVSEKLQIVEGSTIIYDFKPIDREFSFKWLYWSAAAILLAAAINIAVLLYKSRVFERR